MAKYKKYIGILFVVSLMLVIFISDAANLGSNKSELPTEFEEYSEVISEENTTEVSPSIIASEAEPIPNASVNVINVKDYGAKGDGITDDTKAFQKALDFASENKRTLVIPKSSGNYLISNSLDLKSNTHIVGYGATLFMPSHRQIQNIFQASSKIEISNITIEGLNFLSENDKEGTGEYENSLTSFVQGIYLYGVDTLTIKDVRMESMYIGIKLDASKNGDKSENISIYNLEIYNSRTPLFITSTTNFIMSESILDASGGATKFLHSAYIRGDTMDIEFNQVQFINSPGGGVHIYNGNDDLAPPEDIRIIDCDIENTQVGIYIYSGAKDIYVANIIMKNIELPFKINNAFRVNIEEVEISSDPDSNELIGLFNIDGISESEIAKISVDGLGMTGYLFDIGSRVNDLTFSELDVSNLYNVGLLYGTSEAIQNLVIENSIFEWTKINGPLMRFQNVGSNVIIRNNEFINSGKKMSPEVFDTTEANVILENNDYTGF